MLNLGSLVGPVTGLLDKFIEDKDVKNKLAIRPNKNADKNVISPIPFVV